MIIASIMHSYSFCIHSYGVCTSTNEFIFSYRNILAPPGRNPINMCPLGSFAWFMQFFLPAVLSSAPRTCMQKRQRNNHNRMWAGAKEEMGFYLQRWRRDDGINCFQMKFGPILSLHTSGESPVWLFRLLPFRISVTAVENIEIAWLGIINLGVFRFLRCRRCAYRKWLW